MSEDKNALAEKHFGLVHACCKRFSGKGVEYEELYAAGCLGLTKALCGFDGKRGLQFSTYAVPVILGEIKRLFRDGGSVHVSRSLRELAIKAKRTSEEYQHLHGREPSLSVLAQLLAVTPEQLGEALSSTQPVLSLTAGTDEDGTPPIDVPTPDIQYEITERLSLQQALRTLSENDQKIIRLRFGIGGGRPHTLEEVGNEFDVTRERIRQIEAKALAKLRKNKDTKKLHEYLR